MSKRIDFHCPTCGGTDVMRESYSDWDVDAQKWVSVSVFDDGYCRDCDKQVSLEEREVGTVALVAVQTSGLIGMALDWAVAKCNDTAGDSSLYAYSTDWAHGGPIIEREGIDLNYNGADEPAYWVATSRHKCYPKKYGAFAGTPLVAAMRCYVASKLGDTVDVPAELVEG